MNTNDVDVVAELRAWRDQFALAHNYDIHAMGETLRAMDLAAGERVVSDSSPAVTDTPLGPPPRLRRSPRV